ncbi:unnamed protein product [Heligmosomoides polygyrus]|uniref:Uncharacterized protein n=1 Tax=Heligmosomoides polygyrus TaxID=6339 RepID=A0A183GP90_HELPZ|nr:unnamed protein product [Heligmosomoides polygyrus]
MEQEEEDSDDDGKALHAALEIIEDFQKGVDVSTLEDRVKALPQSPTIGTIHEALAVIIRNASHSKPTRTPSPTWIGASTPYPLRDSSDCETDQCNGMVKRMLSLSPAMQTGTSDYGRVHDNAQPAVPRLQLELDFSPSSSVNHSPLLTPCREAPNDDNLIAVGAINRFYYVSIYRTTVRISTEQQLLI